VDEITEQALTNMVGVLESFLPPALPDVDQSVILIPEKVKPTGLGGYVGVNEDPESSLFGRYIHAISEITLVSTVGVNDLQRAVSNITHGLLAQGRQTLRSNGIFKLDLGALSAVAHAGSGNNAIDNRSIRFNLEFEFIPEPVESEGNIDQLEISMELAFARGKAEFLDLDFSILHAAGEDPLNSFDFLDDPDIVASSPRGNWIFNDGIGALVQNRNVRGGPAILTNAKKAGAQALVLDDGESYLARNLLIHTKIESGAVNGIGLVFRWRDENNFYFYLMSAQHNYHLIGKKMAGGYAFLEDGGINDELGYTRNQAMDVKLLIEDETFKVYLNDSFVMVGVDREINQAGRVGFLSHRNNAARFYNLHVVRFDT